MSPPGAVSDSSDRAVRIPGAVQALVGEVFPLEIVLPIVLFFWELLVQQLPQVSSGCLVL